MNCEPLVVALRYITHDPTPTPPQYNGYNATSTPPPPLERYIICARPLSSFGYEETAIISWYALTYIWPSQCLGCYNRPDAHSSQAWPGSDQLYFTWSWMTLNGYFVLNSILRRYVWGRAFFKNFVELHNTGGLGTEVPQRGPGAERRYGVWGTKSPEAEALLLF